MKKFLNKTMNSITFCFDKIILVMLLVLAILICVAVFFLPKKDKADFKDETEDLKKYNSRHYYED